ncbi:MAG: type VI secretion system membrane subunit TssM, partial [Pararhodobacter sp.]
RMREALAVLRRSNGSSAYLYELPWYVIIGPPGAGKTTALLNSGLRFPLADKAGAMGGTGGTRYCDWWFTEEAVLIDTAGRYTTQDSDAEADSESWLSFLALLKRHRPRQPVNGVIVALGLDEILTGDEQSLAAHSAAIRDRLRELHEVFRIDVPVYVLFTKADLIAGFTEFFGAFSAARRQKVWGTTFRPGQRRDPTLPQVGTEFDALVRRLSVEVTDRMQDEPDGVSRIAIFGFPAQVAMLRDRVVAVLEGVFGASRYKVNATLRGFYFASGTQEGTPIDQILGAMERAFGPMGHSALSGQGKSYFLHDLLRKVIFAEAGWVTQDRSAVRREAAVRYGILTALVLAMVGLSSVWGWAFYQNRSLMSATAEAATLYEREARAELGRNEIADPDLLTIEPLLQHLRAQHLALAEEGGGLADGFGLGQGRTLAGAARAAYRDGLERHLRPRLMLHLEERIAEDYDENDLMSLYQSVKTYKLLIHQSPEPDNDA